MRLKKTYYTVAHHGQEFDCFQCGEPVDVGDRALEIECAEREANFAVCSAYCNTQDLEAFRNHPDNN